MTTDDSSRVAVLASGNPDGPPPDQGHDLSILDLFRWIYKFFYSKTVGLVIILATTVLVLLGVVIGQAPAGTYDDPVATERFLDQASEKYGGWATIFDALGLFRVFSSVIFLVVIAMLGLSIVACTVHRIPQLWRRYNSPRTHVNERFFDRGRYRGSIAADVSADEAMNAVRSQLARKRYRVIDDERDPGRSLYADRYAWGGFGTVIAHASFIVILVAFGVSSSFGIEETLTVPVGGDPVDVGNGTGLSVEAPAFEATHDDAGRPLDYVSHLILRDGDKVVGDQDVRVNEPLRYQGLRFHQLSYGIAADVEMKDAAGATLFDGSVPLQWTSNDGTNVIGKFFLEEQDLEILIVTPASGATQSTLSAGQASFEVYQGGSNEPVLVETVEQGSPAELGEFTILFEREREYTGIMVRQDPGAAWMWVGSGLLVVGMMITFMCRHRRLWIRVEDDNPCRIRFASADKADSSFERQFRDLIVDTTSVLDKDSTTEKEGKDA